MKGNEIIDFIVQNEMPELEQVREKCLLQATAEKRQIIKRPLLLASATLATAAVLAMCFLLGNTLFSPKPGNSFSLKAYALEQQEDGSFQINDTIVDDSGDVLGYGTGGDFSYYRGLYLNFEGQNIQSVEFYAYDDEDYAKTHHPTECGEIMFARQHVLMVNGKIIYSPVGPFYDADDTDGNNPRYDKQLYTTTPFQRLGNRFTMTPDELTEDLLLYVGRIRLRGYVSPNLNITVHAVATFTDGTTQEETFFVQ